MLEIGCGCSGNRLVQLSLVSVAVGKNSEESVLLGSLVGLVREGCSMSSCSFRVAAIATSSGVMSSALSPGGS